MRNIIQEQGINCMQNSKLDTSKEFIIQNWNNGVKLIKPEESKHNITTEQEYCSIGRVFKLPFSVYSPIVNGAQINCTIL